MTYTAPLDDMLFALDLAGLPEIAALPAHADATPDLIAAIIEEAGKFGAGVLAPINATGDTQGCSLNPDGSVRLPDGAVDAYAQFLEAGWNGLPFDPEYGGQGLPGVVGVAVQEIWQAANMAWALCPLLTTGTIEALTAHGTDEQKALFLPKLVTGEWTGTMNLTDPRPAPTWSARKADPARPERRGRLSHLRPEDLHHLRRPRPGREHRPSGAGPPPTRRPGSRGSPCSWCRSPGRRRRVAGRAQRRAAVSLEHKLGIHGSPTCVMAYGDGGGAIGTLLGEPNRA